MLRAALSRFSVVLAITLLLCAVAVWWHSVPLFSAVIFAFLVAIGLGVKIPQLRLFGPYICSVPTSGQFVALTFDDGPDPRSTPALLDLLREAKVTATFFCVGERVAANPELAARIVREGHLLENHSYFHNYATNFFTVARLREELCRTQTAIRDVTGVAPKCFRPPMGLSNPRIFIVARRLGLAVIGWTARGWDTKLTDPDKIVARIVRKIKPGAIILLHDGNIPAARLVATVKTLLDTLRALGYQVVRLDQLLNEDITSDSIPVDHLGDSGHG